MHDFFDGRAADLLSNLSVKNPARPYRRGFYGRNFPANELSGVDEGFFFADIPLRSRGRNESKKGDRAVRRAAGKNGTGDTECARK